MSRRERERVAKTNAMRELERGHITYVARELGEERDISRGLGLRMAREAGEDPQSQFKTLVCVAPSGGHVVCCIPVADELDLKKAAAAAGEKSLELLPVKDLESVTGYVRGGCTPVGMRRQFPILIDETAQLFDTIGISGGRRGLSLDLDPEGLAGFVGATFADIVQGGDSLR